MTWADPSSDAMGLKPAQTAVRRAGLRQTFLMDAALKLLRRQPAWDTAVANLRTLHGAHGEDAQRNAEDYAAVYSGCRGAMIVDVVASRQRRYVTRVKETVAKWRAENDEHTISWLAEHPLEHAQYGLAAAEVDTIHSVALSMGNFMAEQGLSGPDGEDEACRRWADGCGPFDHAPRLDPIVGAVEGIGIALFAYMRMRSDSDAIKPDVRVRKALHNLEFSVPNDEHAVLIIAKAAADEIGVSRLVLDQLLWWT
jgi:hypothetical protein